MVTKSTVSFNRLLEIIRGLEKRKPDCEFLKHLAVSPRVVIDVDNNILWVVDDEKDLISNHSMTVGDFIQLLDIDEEGLYQLLVFLIRAEVEIYPRNFLRKFLTEKKFDIFMEDVRVIAGVN